MKLVLATPLHPPEIGGPATYAKILMDELPQRGIEVALVKFSDVRHLPNAIRQIAYCLRILSAARNAEVILALDAVSVGWPTFFANLFLHKKFVVKIVGDHIWEQGRQRFGIKEDLDTFPAFSWRWNPYLWFLRSLQFIVVRNAARVIVPSEYLKKIVQKWSIPGEKVKVIYNAVSVDEIGQIPESVSALPRPLVVTVGRLVEWKGIRGLMRVFDGVWSARREGSDASLVVVGQGPEEKELKSYAETLNIKNQCLFTGELSHAETLAVIKTGDIFVLNSSYEGLSHTLIEAVKLGACIIATDAGGNGEIIVNGNGLIFKTGKEELLASDLKMLIEHQEKRLQLSAAAKESSKRFSVETMLSETITLLTSL